MIPAHLINRGIEAIITSLSSLRKPGADAPSSSKGSHSGTDT